MLRRLLTCLALITGLAASGAPAAAAIIGTAESAPHARIFAPSPGNGQVCTQRGEQAEPQVRVDDPGACKRVRTVTVFLPTVQLKADRAYE